MRLEARDLGFCYHRKASKPVLHGVDLALETGQRVGLTAPSGRGKTTLCKLLSGYEAPDQGQVLLDGRPLSRYRGFCPVQMIWQHPETVVDPLLPLGETLREAGAVSEEVLRGLHIEPGWLDRYPTELSGGELQRFCIARALHPAVRFLLCDEITAMLDLIAQAQIWAFLLDQAARRDLGLLIVSHDGPLLDRLCTRSVTLEA